MIYKRRKMIRTAPVGMEARHQLAMGFFHRLIIGARLQAEDGIGFVTSHRPLVRGRRAAVASPLLTTESGPPSSTVMPVEISFENAA
jgi:hypothetical protein